MECKVKWIGPDGMSFVAETESGHAFVMDGAPEGGGRNLGPRPMEAVLAGTGGCTPHDVVLILRKNGQSILAFENPPGSKPPGNHPQGVTQNHNHLRVTGQKLKPSLV